MQQKMLIKFRQVYSATCNKRRLMQYESEWRKSNPFHYLLGFRKCDTTCILCYTAHMPIDKLSNEFESYNKYHKIYIV